MPIRILHRRSQPTLVRVGPPQCLASVLSSLWVFHLDFSLDIETTGSRSSLQKPETESRHLYAEHRPHSNQISDGLCPGAANRPQFRCHFSVLRRVISDSLSFVFLSHTCRFSRLFPRRSPPWLFTTAARGGLKPASGDRLRRAFLHLPQSLRNMIRFFFLSWCFYGTHSP